ncbi:MAG: hypothetical protein L6R39_003918, partial [Caloplaca ligustica]
MPPLAELSVNRPGKTKQASLNGTSTSSGKHQPPTSVLNSNSSSLPTTSAIQSMLKNTTELGDIGHFIANPTNIRRQKSTVTAPPRARQQQQFRRSYLDYAVSTHSSRRPHYPNPHYRRDQPLHHNPSLKTNGGRSLTADSQDQPSDSVTQSSITSRRVSVHPSLPNIRPFAGAGPKPRALYAYPSRLKRSGHRPSSPAYSEINISDSALHTSIRAYSTRTGSPLSTSSARKVSQPWKNGFNRSDPLLQYYPPAPISRRHDGNRSPPFSRRAALPGSPLASHRSSMIGKPRALKTSRYGSSGVRREKSPPLFYDYSEAFEKESFNHTAQRSSLFEARHIPQSDGSSEGYQADVTNTSTTSTKHSKSSTNSKAATPERVADKGKRPSPLRSVSQALKQKSRVHNKVSEDWSSDSLVSDEVVIHPPSDDTAVIKLIQKTGVSSMEHSEQSMGNAAMADPFTVPSVSHNGLQRPQSTYDPAPKVIKSAAAALRFSSSSSGSQYSSSNHSRQHEKSEPSPIRAPEMAYERQPKALSVNFNRLDMIRSDIDGVEPEQRAASLDTHVRPTQCQIFAPVPERSMSSRDSRDRFSRILSIGEDFGKRDMFATTLPNQKAPMTIQQYLRDRKTPSHKPKSSLTKELPPLPDDPSPVPGKGKEKEIVERDGRGSSQSTNAEQLVGLDADACSIVEMEHAAALDGFARSGIPPRFSSISKHSQVDRPESSRSARASILSKRPTSGEQPRRFPLTPRNSSLFQTMKELPPLPKEAVVAIPPRQKSSPLELPCLFTPLLQEERLDTAVADIKDNFKTKSAEPAGDSSKEVEVGQHTPPQPFAVGTISGPASTASHTSARPWNVDANYPWAGTPPKLEVSIPQPTTDPAPEVEKQARFRLNIRRASVQGPNRKLSKHRPPNIKVDRSAAAGREVTPISTRFTEVLENNLNEPPTIALMPPSPGLQIEAQSFFSDDSSHRGQKNSIRRRLSQIRDAMRVASADDVRVPVSPTFGFPRTSKGSSKRSSTAPDTDSPRKFTKWKMLDRIKNWLQRREETIKKWRRRLSPRNHHARPLGSHVYPG